MEGLADCIELNNKLINTMTRVAMRQGCRSPLGGCDGSMVAVETDRRNLIRLKPPERWIAVDQILDARWGRSYE